MPEGFPSDAQLKGQQVKFFSLDTSIIQSAGYNFSEGALHSLASQRPDWMCLQLTEIVEREVKAHRMKLVIEAMQRWNSANSDVERATSKDLSPVKVIFDKLSSEQSANAAFDEQIKQFVTRLGGDVLPIEGSWLAEEMFTRYFNEIPPFERKKDKKSEFPDAAALLVLEEYAKKNETLGILISRDTGWISFANRSKFLYCVGSLDEFTALFATEDTTADNIKWKIKDLLANRKSLFARKLGAALKDHIDTSPWMVNDLYASGSERLEGEICNVELSSYDWINTTVWINEQDSSKCLVGLVASAEIEVEVSVEVFVWDSVDREELSLGYLIIKRSFDPEIEVFLTCTGNLQQSPSEWEIEIEIAKEDYSVNIGEVDVDFGPPD